MSTFLPITHNFTAYQGDKAEFQMLYEEGAEGAETGKAISESTTFLAQIRPSESEDVTATITIIPDADQVTNAGLFTILLPPAQSCLLTGDSYLYDIEFTWDGDDTDVQTIAKGTISVIKEVSR